MTELASGARFPQLVGLELVNAQLGQRPFVLYFFPKAFTGGWTTEAQDFERSLDQLASCGVQVFGCSTDSEEVNRRFQEELGVHFPILSDAGGQAARELGILGDTGRAKRTTFLVDGQGVLHRVWYDVKVAGHAEAVTKEAETLA